MRDKSKINRQSSKSTSSKKRRNKRDIISTPPHREFPAATSTFSGLAILVSAFLGFLGVNNTYAASISVSISGEMNLNLVASDEGMFGTSTPTTISVVSSNSSGYTLTLTGDRNDGKLVGSNPEHYFTSITSPLTEAEFNTPANNGKWGILPSKYNSADNTSYQKAPTTNEPATIDTTSMANYSPNTYTLAVAARANTGAGSMTLADEYSGTFTLAATGNAIDYDIAYVDDSAGLPGLTYGSSSTGTATVSSTVPTKPGYEFAGWCNTEVALGAACTGTTYPAGSEYVLSSGDNNVTLHAIWDPITFAEAFGSTAMNMQNMTTSICDAVAIGQEATLSDTRGGSYNVGKMKDGHCWMLDNLALGGSSTITLTPTNTNITSNWTLPASVARNFSSYTEARINTDYKNIVSPDAMSQAGGWKAGVYYNFCAASAGTYCMEYNALPSDSVKSDLCPSGWRMPTGDIGGEYGIVYSMYDNYNIFRASMHLSLSGVYDNDKLTLLGSESRWWSKTFHSGHNMFRLGADETNILPLTQGGGRQYGMSVRCIAK